MLDMYLVTDILPILAVAAGIAVWYCWTSK